jgi:hypothetical protein
MEQPSKRRCIARLKEGKSPLGLHKKRGNFPNSNPFTKRKYRETVFKKTNSDGKPDTTLDISPTLK